MQGDALVEYAAKRPDVRLGVVGLVFPDLRTRIVGSTCLGSEHVLMEHLAHVKIAE